MRINTLLPVAILVTLAVAASPAAAADDEVAEVRATFEKAVAALNAGNMEGFLDTVHDEALSFYSCGPTSGKQGREACALDWQLFFSTTTDARFETRNDQYRVIGDTGIAYGEYSLSVNYNGQGRQTVHEGRYTMTYTRVGEEWRIAMQHNTPAGEAPQPVRNMRREPR
jgi:uncharacterized protein (TIGR02246 family)